MNEKYIRVTDLNEVMALKMNNRCYIKDNDGQINHTIAQVIYYKADYYKINPDYKEEPEFIKGQLMYLYYCNGKEKALTVFEKKEGKLIQDNGFICGGYGRHVTLYEAQKMLPQFKIEEKL